MARRRPAVKSCRADDEIVQFPDMSLRLRLPNPFGGSIWYKERTASTMDDIRALIQRGEPEGTVAAAGFQAEGRGRFADRRWETGPGEALLFTIALRAPRPAAESSPASARGADRSDAPAQALAPSLRLALGVALFLESLGLKPVIKWPNDLLLDERKVCGILVVGSGEWLYGGIGLNLRQSYFSQGLRRPATSLLLAGRDLAPEDALSRLLPWLHTAYFHPDARSETERRLWRLHEEIEVEERVGHPPRRGRVSGLGAEGALLLETPGGTVRCLAGE